VAMAKTVNMRASSSSDAAPSKLLECNGCRHCSPGPGDLPRKGAPTADQDSPIFRVSRFLDLRTASLQHWILRFDANRDRSGGGRPTDAPT